MQNPYTTPPDPPALLGDGKAMSEVERLVEIAAQSDITVMLTGESGTGKSLTARRIHSLSGRRAGPLVQTNCASLTETLLDSELFGHERGSFTGAERQHIGKFEVAGGGTLFLDEIEELSARAQAKLLNVIEEGVLVRVGGEKEVRTDVRLIVAANRDLDEMVREGAFRRDLFYRLRELAIQMPSLRDRREDIPDLARCFAVELSRELGVDLKRISDAAMAQLVHYDWPGNVRELRNVIKSALVVAEHDAVWIEDLPISVEMHTGDRAADDTALFTLDEAERRHVERVLAGVNWKKIDAARVLGITRATLDRKIAKHGLTKPEQK
jgi:DNA-binding NtrC family response regulator